MTNTEPTTEHDSERQPNGWAQGEAAFREGKTLLSIASSPLEAAYGYIDAVAANQREQQRALEEIRDALHTVAEMLRTGDTGDGDNTMNTRSLSDPPPASNDATDAPGQRQKNVSDDNKMFRDAAAEHADITAMIRLRQALPPRLQTQCLELSRREMLTLVATEYGWPTAPEDAEGISDLTQTVEGVEGHRP